MEKLTDKIKNLEVFEDLNFLIGNGTVWTQKNITLQHWRNLSIYKLDNVII